MKQENKYCKLDRNLFKKPHWWEADQLVIYKAWKRESGTQIALVARCHGGLEPRTSGLQQQRPKPLSLAAK